MAEGGEEGRKPYFETVKSFAEVQVTEVGVHTLDFLEASEGMATMLGLLNAKIFDFLQSDIRGNIKGVKSTHDSNPDECKTLEGLCRWQKEKEPKHDGVGSLRRLTRGLLLTCRALQSSQANASEEMHTSFKRAYEQVLRPHLGWIAHKVVSVALSTAPTRADFYARIAQGGTRDRLDARLAEWLSGLDGNLQYVVRLYEERGWGRI
ncbi:glycolipid transfer protein [Schizopora paradoxa]|uniref:Glycolipid transfer protein n=1 Tax=Schizopora paradoxa TaxID=27342 RepID=A0A0H2RHE9_9AGAM|nr:glycolipid transfer protein [Schizopora paradoxa]